MARIGINGFGRIGRYLVRLMAERNEFPVVINARADNASLAHLFKYDSVHHTFKGTVGHDENGIIINGTHIADSETAQQSDLHSQNTYPQHALHPPTLPPPGPSRSAPGSPSTWPAARRRSS